MKGADLFRAEALAYRSGRLAGDVTVAVPVSWQSIGSLLFGGVAAILAFLSVASYSRVEIASGIVTTERGVLAIIPSREGVISAVAVRDGQTVKAGAALATIRAEEDSDRRVSVSERVERAIQLQDTNLRAQLAAAETVTAAQLEQLAAQRAGLSMEVDQLESQIALQQKLVDSAQADLTRAAGIAARGFISQRDLQLREEALLTRKQGLSQLVQALANKRATLNETSRSVSQVVGQARERQASLAASRAAISQQAASAAGARSYVMRAPIDGQVSALTVHHGQSVGPQSPLMTIIPAKADLRVELKVPTSAIGFVRRGQAVALAIDAFPYQRFGTLTGRVETVASSPITTSESGKTTPAYLVTVRLEKPSISAFGHEKMLMVGMTLDARIVTEKQSLLEWLFEPLFAVHRR